MNTISENVRDNESELRKLKEKLNEFHQDLNKPSNKVVDYNYTQDGES
jgi:hypothetical protein